MRYLVGVCLFIWPLFLVADSNMLFEADLNQLQAIESEGFHFSEMLCGKRFNENATVKRNCPKYRQLVEILKKDISDRGRRAKEKLSTQTPDLFQSAWLTSKNTSFQLVGLVNRFDRLAFYSNGCGEIRLIYRLLGSYEEDKKQFKTYLPLNAMVVFEVGGDIKQCLRTKRLLLDGKLSLKDWLKQVSQKSNKRLELNLLNLRFPSPTRADTAGYSEYLMRIFRIGSRLEVMALENTPDVQRIGQSQTLKKQLLKWIKNPSNKSSIELGVAKIPDKFLATVAFSVAPFGALRLVNAPFSQLFSHAELGGLAQSKSSHLNRHLLRRLNGMTCQGCHQTKSDAGFHFIGRNHPKSFELNRTESFASAHFHSEQQWRVTFLHKYSGKQPYMKRPLPGRTWSDEGRAGDHCTGEKTLKDFGCRKGQVCRQLWDVPDHPELQVGYCQMDKAPLAGEPCLLGKFKQKNGIEDQLTHLTTSQCFGYGQCMPQEIGFPGGLCITSCEALMTHTGCAPVPALQKFTECRNKGKGLNHCFSTSTNMVALRQCDIDLPCRPDYVCAVGSKHGKNGAGGLCVPPYFLPQLNIRDHRL